MTQDFIDRLHRAFEGASMATVARRLKLPHATVRNYYKEGRLPAPEVLIKIANETGISLNWLLIGAGEMYASNTPPITLGKFIEDKINEIIDRKLASAGIHVPQDVSVADEGEDTFDVASAVMRYDDPQQVMNKWLAHEGREFPTDFGIVFFRGWETFSPEQKVEAVIDAKRVLDRSI